LFLLLFLLCPRFGLLPLPVLAEGIDQLMRADRAARVEGHSHCYGERDRLFLSATMRWLGIAMEGAMELVLDEQLDLLRGQMVVTKAEIQSSKAQRRR
jgi:hypothetical protein